MNKISIQSVHGTQIIDSRGNPTVKATIYLTDGTNASASVPSGASTGIYEAVELRDNDLTLFNGKSVLKAIDNINSILAPTLCKIHSPNQYSVDMTMLNLDGTPNKSKIGANATLAVSLAFARACSKLHHMPLYQYIGGSNAHILPIPMMNILNGGAHASNNVDIQEFMIMPIGASSICEGIRWGCEIYHTLGKLLRAKGLSSGVGDEGGFAPDLPSDEAAVELILEAIAEAGYTTEQVKLALDVASSEWYSNGVYNIPKRKESMKSDALIDYLVQLSNKYPIVSIEDGMSEDDWEGWGKLSGKLRGKVQLVGDDLFVTNVNKLKMGIEKKVASSILIKPNQIGTLSETLDTIQTAKQAGYTTVISHRSGETEDTTIADLAVAVNSGQIKTGAPCRSDRVAKYNRLLAIENGLGDYAKYGTQ